MSESVLLWGAICGLAVWFYHHNETCKDRWLQLMEKLGKLEGKDNE
jgi:hypothetical protein